MGAVGAYVTLVLVFGDAVRQSTPAQRTEIEQRVMPLTEDLRERHITKAREVQLVRRILNELSAIMGDEWQLDPETKSWVQGLLR